MICSGNTELNRRWSMMIMSRLLYETGIFRDSGQVLGKKPRERLGGECLIRE
jgi:hypothetical protein